MENVLKKLETLIAPPRIKIKNQLKTLQPKKTDFKKISKKLKTYDKINFPIIIYKNIKRTKKLIIYTHSYASCKNEGLSILKTCQELNSNLCIYDSRGCGESSKSEVTFGFREKIDLLFVVLENVRYFGDCEIVLWARSVGCNCVLQFLRFLREFKALFLEIKEFGAFFEFEKVTFEGFANNERFGKFKENFDFDKFLEFKKYFDLFFEYNCENKNDFNFDINILGTILDAPYISFRSFVKENIKKKFYFGFLFSKPINLFLEKWLKTKIKIDITKFQNNKLIKKTNINTVFIISKNDELISIDKSLKLIKNFGLLSKNKNKPQIFFHQKKHGFKRPLNILHQSYDFVIKNYNSENTFYFNYNNKINDLIENLKKNKKIKIEREREKNYQKDFSKIQNGSFKKQIKRKNYINFYEKNKMNNNMSSPIFKKKNYENFCSIENKNKNQMNNFISVKEYKEKNNVTIFDEIDLNLGFSRKKSLKKNFSLVKINSFRDKIF